MQKLKRLFNDTFYQAKAAGTAAPHGAFQPPVLKIQPMLRPPVFAAAARPIFVIGAPRSGTSITCWALGQHPNIQMMPETGWIAAMAVGTQQSYYVGSERGHYSHLSNVALAPEPFFRRIGEAIDHIVRDVFEERCRRLHGEWRDLAEIKNPDGHPNPEMRLRRRNTDPKTRWVDATPLNSMYAWSFSLLFPEARFIHLIREPHEVVASLENFDAAGGQAHHVIEGLKNWHEHTYMADLTQKALGSQRVCVARFDKLTSDPKSFFGGILSFLGEEWSHDCLAPLGTKINSSQVDDEREKVRAAIANNPSYVSAKALYDGICSQCAPVKPDAAALADLKLKFLQHAGPRKLI